MSIDDRREKEVEVNSYFFFFFNLTNCIGEVSWQVIKNARGRIDLTVG